MFERAKKLYHLIAGFYDAIDPGWRKVFYRDVHRAFDRAVATHLPPGGRVLDLGCGTGANLMRLIDLELDFGAYVGVDFSPEMLARVEPRFADRPDVRFQQLDLIADPLPEGPFDLVVSTWVFEHLPDPVRVMEKTWERVRPGGHAVLLFEIETDSFRSRLWNWVYHSFGARFVPQEVYQRIPGERVAFDHFPGFLGDVVLMVCRNRPTPPPPIPHHTWPG